MLSERKYSYNSKCGEKKIYNSVVLMRKFLTHESHEQLRVSKGIYAFKSKYVGYMLLVLEKNAKVSKSTFMPKNRKTTNSSDMKWIGISWYLPYGHRFDSFGFASCYLPRMIRGHS